MTMREGNWTHATMVSPAPGFAARVMARIEERERVRARRRSVAGGLLLVLASAVAVVLFGIVAGSTLITLASDPDIFSSALSTLAVLADLLRNLLYALWTVAAAFSAIATMPLLVFAAVVCGLTFLWV